MANTRSLLSSQARIQAPWIKVKIGEYSFGVFDRKTKTRLDTDTFLLYESFGIEYPNYIQSLNIIKINGQVNQYTLTIIYPVRACDDPNFFEKVFSSVSSTRKIVFSYGDATMPTYVYKDEEAIITGISQQFNLEASSITYTVKAVSSALVGKTGAYNFMYSGLYKPSDLIKQIFLNKTYGLQSVFTGMGLSNYASLIAGDDKAVQIVPKTNMAPLDYITYLVGCMVPAGASTNNLNNDLYILTIHDDTVYDKVYNDEMESFHAFKEINKDRDAYSKRVQELRQFKENHKLERQNELNKRLNAEAINFETEANALKGNFKREKENALNELIRE